MGASGFPGEALLYGAAALLSPAGARGRLSVLIYHRVLAAPDPLLPGEVDAALFERQMGMLARHFTVLPLPEAVRRLREGKLPARAAAVTFDDGYRDNFETALPILQRLGLPATFFIATGYLDGGRMWNDTVIEAMRRAPDREVDLTALGLGRYPTASAEQRRRAAQAVIAVLKYREPTERDRLAQAVADRVGAALPDHLMMTSAQVAALHGSGMEIGGHTASHPILSRLDPAAARSEIAAGRDCLEGLLGTRPRLFAYPNGKPGRDYQAEHVKMVRELGFEAAVSTAWGAASSGADLFQLPRFTPWDKTPVRFAGRLVRNLWRGNGRTV
jgi:peptidoglycan/xylan/chitin deacetylase (PgdA/CDA1 family)